MINFFHSIFLVSLLVVFSNVSAEETIRFSSGNEQTMLVELFTSQGCSSCPPAESWLNKFENNNKLWKQVVPIAFHVDYWDKLGWPDIYAKKAYTKRQYQHRIQNNIRSVYTPGVIVNGQEWRGWIRGSQFPSANSDAGILSATVNPDNIKIDYSDKSKRVLLNVVLLGVGIETDVKRGENKNRILKQDFVALSHELYAANSGNWEVNLPRYATEHAEKYALAIWVSSPDDISPIQATGYWVPKEWIES